MNSLVEVFKNMQLSVTIEHWPIAKTFTIARGSKTQAVVVVAQVSDGEHTGRGECVPYARYGETAEGVAATIELMRVPLAEGLTRYELQSVLPAGAARNALDCALWDLEAKRSGKRVWELIGQSEPQPLITAYTLSLESAEQMAEAAAEHAHRPVLKIKLGAEGDAERIAAVRQAAPHAQLIVDANEGWTAANVEDNFRACSAASVSLIEQPLPAQADHVLATINRPVPLCADESLHDLASLNDVANKYDAINIKLDKTGGLTEALTLREFARARKLTVMVGCMLGTSLAMAPAVLLAQSARIVDLDGPLLLAQDRQPGLYYDERGVYPPEADVWG
jgi:L-alanine-DL-glutamate epimerase-like enolase superfamily enzyme